eukprot:gene2037-18213_t
MAETAKPEESKPVVTAEWPWACDAPYAVTYSKFNPTPGTGRTGMTRVPPNNYPFYNKDEQYMPCIQQDGGQLSEWMPMYNPSKEKAEEDRAKAYESKVPHGYVPAGDKFKGLPTIDLLVNLMQHDGSEFGGIVDTETGEHSGGGASHTHDGSEYGGTVDPQTGEHSGGPFTISVSPKMRVEELRKVIRDKGGIPPALQRLSYAGKHMEDSQRTLEHYGVSYWHKQFPNWPIEILTA